MAHGDILLVTNFRADRIQQLCEALLDDDFSYFDRRKIKFAHAVSMNSYSKKLNSFMHPVIKRRKIENALGAYIAAQGMQQLRIAETEKYAHVTYFFNCGKDVVLPNEQRILVPSPQVDFYDQKPEMSAYEIIEQLMNACHLGSVFEGFQCDGSTQMVEE